MYRGPIIAALIVLVGSELAERVRVKQEELILTKLPDEERMSYFEHLRRRVRRTRLLRGVVLICLLATVMAVKRILLLRAEAG